MYDAWDRLVSASDGTNAITYQYDGTGRLTERIVAGGTTEKYFYSGQQAVQIYSYSSGGTFQGGQQYIWSPLYVDTPILRDTYDASGDLVSTARLYYTTDANHNVTSVTNSSGVVQERYSYTAYGQVTVYDRELAEPEPDVFGRQHASFRRHGHRSADGRSITTMPAGTTPPLARSPTGTQSGIGAGSTSMSMSAMTR